MEQAEFELPAKRLKWSDVFSISGAGKTRSREHSGHIGAPTERVTWTGTLDHQTFHVVSTVRSIKGNLGRVTPRPGTEQWDLCDGKYLDLQISSDGALSSETMLAIGRLALTAGESNPVFVRRFGTSLRSSRLISLRDPLPTG